MHVTNGMYVLNVNNSLRFKRILQHINGHDKSSLVHYPVIYWDFIFYNSFTRLSQSMTQNQTMYVHKNIIIYDLSDSKTRNSVISCFRILRNRVGHV